MTAFNEQWMARMAQGDSQAFASVYEATKSSVYGFALSIVQNRADAEDVMHDAYINLYKSAGQYEAQGKPMAYLLTIVKRLAYNKLRSGRHLADMEDDQRERTAARADHTTGMEQQVEDQALLDMALKVLDDQERQIVVLHALTGLKHREIAELMELGLSTVLSKYRRSLAKMKNELELKGVSL